MNLNRIFMAGAVVLALGVSPAFAQKFENQKGSTKNAEIPVCGKNLGTIALVDGDGQGWLKYQLGAPSTLLKTFVNKSQCFKMVNRGAGMAAIQNERALASGGDLQRGSNMGAGQIKAADWLLVADIAAGDQNSGGGGFGALAGGLIGGRVGAIAGGINMKKVEATTVLSLVNVRTSEEEYNIEGFAKKTDISFGGGGFVGWAGAAGGGYADTEVGKVVGLAFLDAYRQLVTQMGGYNASVVATAPKKAFVTTASVAMKRSPANSSSTVRTLEKGAMVYPLEGKEDMWWEIEDENGNVGWVNNASLKPKT